MVYAMCTQSVLIQGVPCRFCQQCAKFQALDEFDGTKR